MKIVCDSCGTKYSIADEKVRGKVFKIRCKKCSHIIVVRGGESAPEEAAAPAEGGWHLVIDGEQVGPIADADVRTKIERGEVKGDTYTWKEGFADWVKLSAVPEFAGLVAGGEDVSVPVAGGDLFTAGAAAAAPTNGADRTRRPSGARSSLFGAGASAGASDVFGAPAAAATRGGGDLFASPAAHAPEESRWPSSGAAAPGHDGGRVESLTGQRHENSVLFSLSNLQSLAMPNAAKPVASSTAPTTEGSGLIDIRAMAASTLGSPAEIRGFGGGGGGGAITDDLPAFGAFSPAAPVLLPLSSNSGPPKWIYPLIIVMVALVGGIVFMAWKVVSAKPAMLVETVQAPAPAPTEPAKAAGPAAEPGHAKPSTIAEENLPPREGSAEAKGEKSDKGEKSEKSEKSEKGEHHHGKGKESGKKVASADDKKGGAAAPNTESVVPKAPKGSIDALLDDAVTSRKGGNRPRVSDDDPSAKKADSSSGPLAKSAVVAGMNSVKGKVADCYNQFKVQGMAMANVVIGKSGKVTSATVSGKFAGTPTGSCVEKAVKSAVFPPSDGFTTPYPFQLK
jgi:predicted Zn finger-like uncharacterized protein